MTALESGEAPGDRLAAALADLAAAAGAPRAGPAGGALQEPEGLPLLEALGLEVPRWVVLGGPGEVPDLVAFPGDRVVVKLLDPRVAHRTEVGGVRVVPRDPEAVGAALAGLAEAASGPDARFLVQEWVPHETGPGGELLLGYRHTREFGPVVTLGLGGVEAELLTASARPGTLQWIGDPGGGDVGTRGGGPFPAPAQVRRVAAALEALPLGALATGRTRGRAGRIGLQELAGAVAAFLELARVAPAYGITEVEVNPLVARDGRPVALDVLVRPGSPEAPAEVRPGRREAIGALLRPRAMGVVGASARGMNPGRVMLRNMVAAGFPRDRIQVVKEGCEELEGCVCVPDVAAMEPVDALVVSVAAGDVPGLLEGVARERKARSVILVSAGLGEGDGGAEAARELDRVLALPGAPAVNGGNCLGIRSRPGSYDTLFLPPWKLGFPERRGPPDAVALLTQSGAFAVARASGLPWLDPRYVVTVGNQVDLTVGDYMEAFLDDPELRVLGVYVEGFRPGDGRRFLEAADRHRAAGRTVVLYRAGRTRHGSDAMASHTASVAGDYAVTRALALSRGVLVADSVREFQDLLTLAVRLDGRVPGGDRVGLLSNAGFECVAMADSADTLEPAELGPDTREALAQLLESAGLEGIVRPRNPLDVTPILGDAGFARAAGLLLADEEVDVGVVGCVPLTPALETLPPGAGHGEDLTASGALAARLGALWQATTKPWVAVVDAGPRYDPFVRALEGHGIPVLRSGDEAVRLLGRWVSSKGRPGPPA